LDLKPKTAKKRCCGRGNSITFGLGQGNDALEALHHTRVEGDQNLASPYKAEEKVSLLLKQAQS